MWLIKHQRAQPISMGTKPIKSKTGSRLLHRKDVSELRKWGRLNYAKQEALADQHFEKADELSKHARKVADVLCQRLLERIVA